MLWDYHCDGNRHWGEFVHIFTTEVFDKPNCNWKSMSYGRQILTQWIPTWANRELWGRRLFWPSGYANWNGYLCTMGGHCNLTPQCWRIKELTHWGLEQIVCDATNPVCLLQSNKYFHFHLTGRQMPVLTQIHIHMGVKTKARAVDKTHVCKQLKLTFHFLHRGFPLWWPHGFWESGGRRVGLWTWCITRPIQLFKQKQQHSRTRLIC